MRLIPVILIAAFMQVSAATLAQKISLTKTNAPLKTVLKELRSQSGYNFVYTDNLLQLSRPVNIRISEANLDEALKAIFSKQPLTYSIEYRTVVLKEKEEISMDKASGDFSLAEERVQQNISGAVTDTTGAPLPGVSVQVKGTSIGVSTDIDGRYQIENIPGNTVLVFSFLGYKTREVAWSGQAVLDIVMQQDLTGLDEVVVVGYGSMKKELLVTPVSSVDPEVIQTETTSSLDRSLQGKIAGVSIKQGSGAPGGGAEIRIRGAGSIGGGNQPLIVIDGIPMQVNYDQERSALSLLNQADIETIDVLKGAAAAAIYGSRGSNGVILVTTKKGKVGRTDFSFSVNTGVDEVLPSTKLDLMNAEEFARWRKENEYEKAAFYGTEITEDDIPEAYRDPELLGEGTDWQDLITKTGLRQEYNMNVIHGANNFTGFFSIGYLNHTGTVTNTSFERASFRANMGYEPNKKFKIELNINPTIRTWVNQVGGNRGTLYGQAAISTPVDDPYRESGPWERENEEYYDEEWDLDIWSPGTFSNNNPIYALNTQYDHTNNFNLLATPALQIRPIDDLTLTSQYNIQLQYNQREFFKPSTITGISNPPPAVANGYYNSDRSFGWQWENTAAYNKSFGNHSISVLAGFSLEHYTVSISRLNGTNYPRDDIRTINASLNQTGSTDESNWSMKSYFARINYDFESKYLVTASIRRDGSSRFGSDNRWATFPAIALGWNLSKESFFPETAWLSNLKIRGSYGTTGSNRIGNYTWIPTLTNSNYTFGGTVVDGLQVSGIENRTLGWEKAIEYAAGMDILLWNGRVSVDLDYYKRLTSNMLWAVAIPISSGFNQIQDNIGEIENKGFEVSVNSTNITNGKFEWNTSFNIAFNRNKVLSLGNVDRIFAGWKDFSLTIPGHPMGMFYGWEQIGILKDRNDVENSAIFPGQLPGTVKYKDLNGDGVITNDDRTFIGNPYPKFNGGLINSFNYKRFDVHIAMSFAHDFDIFSQIEGDVLNLDGVFNVLKIAEERWRSPENPGNGEIPTSIHQTFHARNPSSKMVNNASYLKVQNITIGYTLPSIRRINSLRIFASAQNAFLFTNYKYGNPEVNREGASSLIRNFHGYDYPISRTFSLGLDVTF